MKNLIKKLLSFTLIVSMVMSMSVTALAAEAPKAVSKANNYWSVVFLPVGENVNETVNVVLKKVIDDFFNSDGRVSLQSAGLAWGPVKVGNLEFKITNPHTGYVHGMGYVNHINFHITKTSNCRI